MPKFKRSCNNPLHETWSKGIPKKLINLKSHGLVYVGNSVKKYMQVEKGVKVYNNISHLCLSCLSTVTSNRRITKYFGKHDFNDVEKFIEAQSEVNQDIKEDDKANDFNVPILANESAVDLTSSQFNDTTTLTASPHTQWFDDSQTSINNRQNVVDRACQTSDGIFLSADEYGALLQKASKVNNMGEDLSKLRSHFSQITQPEMDPVKFEKICQDIGVANLFYNIFDALLTERMSKQRKELNKVRTMAVIYIMMYSQSQQSNLFQIALSRTLNQFGISQQGLQSLHNLGIASHPRTINTKTKSSALSHLSTVTTFVQSAIDNEHLLIFCIDDYHNIHTKHRPESKMQTQSIHMSTMLLKAFPNIQAVSNKEPGILPASPVDIPSMKEFLINYSDSMSKSFADNMPDWAVAKYFDPECERQRLLIHDYQQTEIAAMRSMDNTKLVDCVELPLKSCDDVLSAVNQILQGGIDHYLQHFVAPFVGDWPMQFYMRRLVYSSLPMIPAVIHHVVPLIGPLHISINARESVLLQFHPIFSDLYWHLFGKKAKLATKPKPWRISLLLEVIYGGWTLIRDGILSVLSKCKNVEYLTLINLLDNYIPLVLSIYSIIFKSNSYQHYRQALFHCWIMFVIFRRRHYDKALLVMLSLLHHWEENCQSMFAMFHQNLVAFDEYAVENFHSVLRSRTKETDNAMQINLKAKEIDACKHELQSFTSTFVPPRQFSFSSKKVNHLKEKAAQFLVDKFDVIIKQPMATQLPRTRGQQKYITKWNLPNLFHGQVVTNKVLPLGFTAINEEPNPNKKCDAPGCEKYSTLWRLFRGCGHSFHMECLLPDISVCRICRSSLMQRLQSLGETANKAVFASINEQLGQDFSIESDIPDDDDDESNIIDEQTSTSCDVTINELLTRIASWNRNI